MTPIPAQLAVLDASGRTRHAVGVHVVLLNGDGEILLQHRGPALQLAPSKWSTPCGNLETEPAPVGAAREAHEELGIEIEPAALEFAHLANFENDQGFGPAFAIFFLARAWSGTPRICEPDKCQSINWYTFDELPLNTVPYVANALAAIRTGLTTKQLGTGFSLHGFAQHG